MHKHESDLIPDDAIILQGKILSSEKNNMFLDNAGKLRGIINVKYKMLGS